MVLILCRAMEEEEDVRAMEEEEADHLRTLEEEEDHSRTILHLDLDCFYAQVAKICVYC